MSRLFSCSINSVKNSLSDSSMTKGLSGNPVVMFAESNAPSGTFRPSKTPLKRPFLKCLLVAAHPSGAASMVATTIAARRLRFDGCRFMVECLLSLVVILFGVFFDLIDQIERKDSRLCTEECSSGVLFCWSCWWWIGCNCPRKTSSTAIRKSVVVFAISRR